MEFNIQSYSCSLCLKDEPKLLLKKQGFSIVQCSNCGFVYVNPRVRNEALGAIYRHNYFRNKDYGYVGYEQEKRLRVKNFEKYITSVINLKNFVFILINCKSKIISFQPYFRVLPTHQILRQ